MIRWAVVAGALLIAVAPADARAGHHHHEATLADMVGHLWHKAVAAMADAGGLAETGGIDDSQILPHPSGCPHTAFCGCGVAVKVFGEARRDLWAAAAWRRFPRAACGSGRVAVWSGHVAYIQECHGDGTATLYDPNSGGHLTRIHRRSLAGATIVDPRG